MNKWKDQGFRCQLKSKDKSYYISYLYGDYPMMTYYSKDETALVTEGEHFYILDGDFRKEYENVFDKGLEACIEVFLSHYDQKSVWSEDIL